MPVTRSGPPLSDDVERHFRGFACPDQMQPGALAETIAATHAREVVRHFVRSFGRVLDEHLEGAGAVLENWRSAEREWESVWNPVFGDPLRLLTGVAPPTLDRVVAAGARLTLHACSTGSNGDWCGTLPPGARLRWGPWVLPPARTITARTDDLTGVVVLDVDEDDPLTFRFRRRDRRSGCWALDGPARRTPSLTPASGRELLLIAAPDLVVEFPEAERSGACRTVEPAVTDSFERAFDILSRHAPAYVPWVTRALHGILLAESDPNPNVLHSGSASDLPGLIFMDACTDPMPVVEMLVHEASHQYFHLVRRVGPVDDGSDTREYFSPFVGDVRPVGRIVAAYHAFANVAIVYRACLDGDLDDGGYCERKQARLLPNLEVCEAALVGNAALTAVGRGLCQPLFDRIAALRGRG